MTLRDEVSTETINFNKQSHNVGLQYRIDIVGFICFPYAEKGSLK